MSKKLILILVLALFFTFNNFALANLIINEIMYDPPGVDNNVEWIKVQNIATTPIDLSTWYVADYDTSWHFHKITGENGTILNVGTEALIVNTAQANFVDFKIKMPNYNGLLFRASFTLGNDQGRLGVSSDKKSILSDTTYSAPALEPTTPVSIVPVKVVAEKMIPVKISKSEVQNKNLDQANLFPVQAGKTQMGIPVENLPIPLSASPIIFIVSFVFIGAAAYGVYFIRRKKVVSEAGSDFEILDE